MRPKIVPLALANSIYSALDAFHTVQYPKEENGLRRIGEGTPHRAVATSASPRVQRYRVQKELFPKELFPIPPNPNTRYTLHG